jgi:hypothetical protein
MLRCLMNIFLQITFLLNFLKNKLYVYKYLIKRYELFFYLNIVYMLIYVNLYFSRRVMLVATLCHQ